MKQELLNEIYILAHDEVVPISLMLELDTKCNERCMHCYIPEHNLEGLELHEIVDVLTQFRALGGLNLSLTGGEIFLRDDILKIIEYARQLYLRVFLLTNATLITKELAESLRKLNIAEISVSIYSMDDKIHDAITGVSGSLRKTLDGIENAEKYDIPVNVKTPLMDINKYAYKDIEKYCNMHGFTFMTSPIIFSRSNGDKTPKKLSINHADLATVLNDTKKFETSRKMNKFEEACGSLKYMLAVDAKGDIYPCNSLYIKLGNIADTTLQQAWDSKQLKDIQNIMKNDLIECRKCRFEDECARCPGLAYLEDGDIYACSSSANTIVSMRT